MLIDCFYVFLEFIPIFIKTKTCSIRAELMLSFISFMLKFLFQAVTGVLCCRHTLCEMKTQRCWSGYCVICREGEKYGARVDPQYNEFTSLKVFSAVWAGFEWQAQEKGQCERVGWIQVPASDLLPVPYPFPVYSVDRRDYSSGSSPWHGVGCSPHDPTHSLSVPLGLRWDGVMMGEKQRSRCESASHPKASKKNSPWISFPEYLIPCYFWFLRKLPNVKEIIK